METISIVLSVRNEETKLGRTLSSVSWADEIIVMDNESTDTTGAIAKKHGAKVFIGKNNPMLNKNKNLGFTKAHSDWILSLDGDEVVSPELVKEIQSIIHSPVNPLTHPSDAVGYWIPRKNILFGKWIQHGLWWPDKQLRLFRRGMGSFPCMHVHEYLALDGVALDLSNPIVHYNYETVSQFIRKMDEIYTPSEVDKHLGSGYRVVWYDALRFPFSDFLKTYFAQAGHKDGLHGLALSMLQAMYSFVVFMKLWEREKFTEFDISIDRMEQEFTRTNKELLYWMLSAKIHETTNTMKQLWYRVVRKSAGI
ncbi:glycosyltransferase family 2 protein [Candidatus Gottesmanbacteria bacterium]|nr:glycosyltransferase family 2 protein [Candidatus Gottesmanbacteria bacterium]